MHARSDIMATKSILKTIDVRDKYFGKKIVDALENAEHAHSKEIVMSRSVKNIGKESIHDIFGE